MTRWIKQTVNDWARRAGYEVRARRQITNDGAHEAIHSAATYSPWNLDAEFRNRFRGWGYTSGAWYLNYRDWSQTSLDTTLGTLRAAGLQGQQLQSEQAVLDRLRVMAQSSDGRMQALQVANQIAEQQVQQIMKLRQLMLADLQSKQAFQAAQIQRQAASESASEKFFTFGGRTGDGRGYQAGQ